MNDQGIMDLYWARNEQALTETDLKYGSFCRTIAYNILRNSEDSEECVNDTWLRAWNTMPPQRPSALQAFLGKITRNLSLDRYKAARAEKRGGGQLPLALAELGDCIPAAGSVEETLELQEITRSLDRFLRSLPERDCCIFLRRYWFVDGTREIAKRYDLSEGTVKSVLHRTRNKLRHWLEQEGIAV